jgi:hypothetical protein
MSPSEATHFWVGFGLAVFLVIFAIVVYFRQGKLEAHQWVAFWLLSSLCAGFAGGLMSGEALFKVVQNWGINNQFIVSGTAGAAFFFAVLFTFPKLIGRPPEDYAFSLPSGWTFKDAATAIAQQDQAEVDLSIFNQAELATQLQARELRTETAIRALISLQNLASPGAIRKYTVSYSAPTYIFRLI